VDYDKILTYTVAVVGILSGLSSFVVNIQQMKKNRNNKKRPNQPSPKRRKGRK